MATYRLEFYKNLVSSDGHPCKALQRVVSIEGAESVEEAIRAGKRRFEQLERIRDWKLHADLVEATVQRKSRVQPARKVSGCRRIASSVPC